MEMRSALKGCRWLFASPRSNVTLWLTSHTLLFFVSCLVLYALVPRYLLQDHDGQSAYYNIAGIFEWRSSWFESSTFSPLYGEGSVFWPYNPSFIPYFWPYLLTASVNIRIYFEMVGAAVVIFATSVLLFRSIRLQPALIISGSWATFVIVMLQGLEWMRGTDAVLLIGLCSASTACLIEFGYHNRLINTLWGLGFVAAVTVAVLAYPGWVVLAVPAIASLSFFVIVSGATPLQAVGRIAVVLATVVLHIVLGSIESIYLMFVNTARVLRSDAYLPFDHVAWLAGPFFRSDATEIAVSTLLLLGLGLAPLHVFSSERRLAATIWIATIVIFAASAVVGLLFMANFGLLRSLKPAYFMPYFSSLVGLFVAIGLRSCWSLPHASKAQLIAQGASPFRLVLASLAVFALLAWHATHNKPNWPILLFVVLTLAITATLVWFRKPLSAAVAFGAVVFVGLFVHAGSTDSPFLDERNAVRRMANQPNPVVNYLSERVGLAPGANFRGYADDLYGVSPPSRQLIDDLITHWAANWRTYGHGMKLFNWGMSGIPTLTQYSPYIDPLYFTLFSAVFNAPQQQQVVNYLTITEFEPRILQLMGLRYIVSNRELSGARVVTRWNSIWVSELPDPNLGSYTPTTPLVATSAAAAVARIKNETFDPRKEFVTENVSMPDDLVATTPANLVFERGGFRVEARSPGRSLIVLPFQYSHCLVVTDHSGDREARLVRVNLFQTGLLFSHRVALKVQYKRWPLAGPSCQRQDYEDSARLLR